MGNRPVSKDKLMLAIRQLWEGESPRAPTCPSPWTYQTKNSSISATNHRAWACKTLSIKWPHKPVFQIILAKVTRHSTTAPASSIWARRKRSTRTTKATTTTEIPQTWPAAYTGSRCDSIKGAVSGTLISKVILLISRPVTPRNSSLCKYLRPCSSWTVKLSGSWVIKNC